MNIYGVSNSNIFYHSIVYKSTDTPVEEAVERPLSELDVVSVPQSITYSKESPLLPLQKLDQNCSEDTVQ